MGKWGAILALMITLSLVNQFHGEPMVPCYFIFGDSSIEPGNNNYLRSFARANYRPYGIDFPGGRPTGRFTNGKLIVDYIAEYLGFDTYIEAVLRAKGMKDYLRGVNYASAGAGILESTGYQFGHILKFSDQLNLHGEIVSNITRYFGDEKKAQSYLSKCIYHVQLGNNDYLANYYLPLLYNTSRLYNPEKYSSLILRELFRKLKTLHGYGARKIVLVGLSPVGCTPNVLAYFPKVLTPCVEWFNLPLQVYNDKLKMSFVGFMNSYYPDSKFIYVDAYNTMNELIERPSVYGFKFVNKGCCGVGRFHGMASCFPFLPLCRDRTQYVFWDSWHLTDAAYHAITDKILDKRTSGFYTYPMTLEELTRL